MRCVLFLALCFVFAASPAIADSFGSANGGTPGNQSNLVGGICNPSPTPLSTGQQAALPIDCTSHNLQVLDLDPSSSPSAALSSVTPAGNGPVYNTSSLIACTAGCNGYKLEIQSGSSAGYIMAFNAASVPADGAVTPEYCSSLAATTKGDFVLGVAEDPRRFAVGMAVVWSTVNFGFRGQTDATGLYVWTFPSGCQHAGNIPFFSAIAEGPTPQGGVTVNPQVEGIPTATTVSFRVTRVSATTVALLGLTILSVATSAATYLDLSCSPQ